MIKAMPMPSFDAVFKPELPHRATAAEPFSFEQRDKEKPSRKSLVQQILEKEKVGWQVHMCLHTCVRI